MTSPIRDIALDDTGDLSFDGADLSTVSGSAAIAQACGIALQLFQGEDAFDQRNGARWHDLLGVKTTTDADIAAEVRRVLLLVQGVASVGRVDVSRSADRRASLDVDVTTDEDELLTLIVSVGA